MAAKLSESVSDEKLRNSSPADLARYLQSLQPLGWQAVSEHLLGSLTSGSIPPAVIFTWLSVCKDPKTIVLFLKQDVSVLARRTATSRFGKRVRTNDFSVVWDAVGGTQGVLNLLASMSVDEVEYFCLAISSSATAQRARDIRQKAMTELWKALGGGFNGFKNPDSRPLMAHYKHIVPACTAEVAVAWNSGSNKQPNSKACLAHGRALEEAALKELFPSSDDGKSDKDRKTVNHFSHLTKQNLRFSLELLSRLAADEKALDRNKCFFMDHTAIPLLRRLSRRRESDDIQVRALELIVRCVQKQSVIAEEIDFGPAGLVRFAIQIWKRARAEKKRIEQLLAALVAAKVTKAYCNLNSITMLMRRVSPAVRYPLLRLLLQHMKWYAVEIDSETEESDSDLKKIEESWPPEIFLLISPVQALKLLKRLTRLHPEGNFLKAGGFVHGKLSIMIVPDPESGHGDVEKLSALLSSRISSEVDEEASWVVESKKILAQRKNKAAFARDPTERVKWANAAMLFAVAIGSLEIYGDTILWARRFNRDAQMIESIYDSNTIATEEGLNLLSGVPEANSSSASLAMSQVAETVQKANRIVLDLLETAAMGLHEPSFQQYHWVSVLDIVQQVVGKRIERAHVFQLENRLSDKDVFDHIWQPTIHMLVQVEKFGLEEEHKDLNFNALQGPLEKLGAAVDSSSATLHFLDKLAEARDGIWQEYRPKVYPSVTTLQPPLPRGLPVRFLCPTFMKGHAGLPYVETRAKAVLFVDEAAALQPVPTDEETQEAIGPFVENYDFALMFYLKSSKTIADRDDRAKSAWAHATTKLTGSRLSKEEAVLTWKHFFDSAISSDATLALPKDLTPVSESVYPKLPEGADVVDPTEWDPNSTYKSQNVASRLIPTATYLDSMLNSDPQLDYYWAPTTIATSFYSVQSNTIGSRQPIIWNIHPYPRLLPRPAGDALAAAAIAYLNTKYGSDTSLLMRPFPSEENARFPALYLDQDFLERISKTTSLHQPLEVISLLSSAIPIQLLVQLAKSLMGRLMRDEKEDPKVRQAAMMIIKRLTRGDRPVVACELVQQVVLERQEDSSWHRNLFSLGFLRRLSAEHSRAFFSELSSRIQRKLELQAEQQAKRREEKLALKEDAQPIDPLASSGAKDPGTSQEVEATSSAPFVKVTTVKMIAQMLRHATFVDEVVACEVLIGLMKGATHPDIRIAIIESLLGMLDADAGGKLDGIILDAFEKHIVPMAASLNERRPTTDEEWLAAETSDGPIPEVCDASGTMYPPILDALLKARFKWTAGSAGRLQWTTRILIPVVDQSTANHMRWISLFAKRNGFVFPDGYLPALPVMPSMLLMFFASEPDFFTVANFEKAKKYSMVNLAGNETLLAANASIRDNPALNKSNAGRHWLALWSHAGAAAFEQGISQIAAHLTEPLPATATAGPSNISYPDLQDFLLGVAEHLLAGSQVQLFTNFLDRLNYHRKEARGLWLTNCLPLLQRLEARIAGLRTEAWQRDQARRPARLPDTAGIRRQMLRLRYRDIEWDGETWRAFAGEASALIEEMVADGAPYHEAWPGLKQTLMGVVDGTDRARFALEIAPGLGKPTLSDYLRIELVDSLLRLVPGPVDGTVVKGVRALLGGWVRSPVESVRLRGEATVDFLTSASENSSGQKGWFSEAGV